MDPWSKGDYSRIIREVTMVVEKVPVVILPSGRVPGRVLLALPILEARRRRNRDAIVEKGSRPEGFETCFKYRPKGGVGRLLGDPGAPPARQRGGRATRAPRPLVAPLRVYFGVLEGSGTLIFYIFFRNFSDSFRNGKT